MKNKVIAVICTVLMFIPTYLAVFYYINAQNDPVNVRVVSAMRIVDNQNNVFEFEKTLKKLDETLSNINDNMIEFFLAMNENSREAILPDQLKGQETFTVSFISYDREAVYKYYFMGNTPEAYYTDNNGVSFKISERYSGLFLMSEYARSLYPASKQPVFTLSGTTVIEPQKLSWEYLNYLDQYTVAASVDDIATVIGTYNVLGGTLTFDFNIEPDSLFVTITENGKTIFSNTYDELASVNLNEDANIKVTVEAKWYENSERGARGEAVYNFYGDIKAQPAFSLGKSIIDPGEFVVLTGLNVDNINDISFSSEPSINYTPVFFEDGKYVRALIPVAFNLPELIDMTDPIQYKFKITVYGKTHELILNVNKKDFRSQPYDVESEIASRRTAKTLDEFQVAMTRTYTSKENTRYWESGKFGLPIPGNESVATGFGVIRNVRVAGATIDTYRHEGTDFLVSYGTPNVCAINKGKVIYVGEQVLSGKIVVIDHGWGLKSTYAHLSEVSVGEGVVVEKGAAIGVVGSTGFTNKMTVHLGLNVFEVPVSPYPLLWNDPDGIPMIN